MTQHSTGQSLSSPPSLNSAVDLTAKEFWGLTCFKEQPTQIKTLKEEEEGLHKDSASFLLCLTG